MTSITPRTDLAHKVLAKAINEFFSESDPFKIIAIKIAREALAFFYGVEFMYRDARHACKENIFSLLSECTEYIIEIFQDEMTCPQSLQSDHAKFDRKYQQAPF